MSDPKEMTGREIGNLRRRNVSARQFLAMSARLGCPLEPGQFDAMPNGEFLGVHSADEGRTYVRLHLKKIWLKPYSLSYRTTKTRSGRAREGREIMIANFPLPRGPVVISGGIR
jgi:hypothetical protein